MTAEQKVEGAKRRKIHENGSGRVRIVSDSWSFAIMALISTHNY
jgi:hypothetical protein